LKYETLPNLKKKLDDLVKKVKYIFHFSFSLSFCLFLSFSFFYTNINKHKQDEEEKGNRLLAENVGPEQVCFKI